MVRLRRKNQAEDKVKWRKIWTSSMPSSPLSAQPSVWSNKIIGEKELKVFLLNIKFSSFNVGLVCLTFSFENAAEWWAS